MKITPLPEGSIKASFRDEMIVLPLDKILPTRVISADQRKNPKFQTIAISMKKVGIIEPPVVAQHGKKGDQYILLDGHIRLEILKEMGVKEVCCLISTDDESYTYNKYISRLSPIQEHTMILKAVERGLSEEELAEALNVNVSNIRRKRDLLTGICPNAVNILKDKMVSASVFPILRQMKDSRQFEAAVLMRDANLYITSFARSLLIATPRDMLVNPDKSYKTKKYSPEQITFQQIQKYESGTNRISASRLVHMAHFLEMPIKWFFDGLDSENATAGAWDAEIFKQRETIELVRAYYGIIDLKKREAGMNILKSLAG